MPVDSRTRLRLSGQHLVEKKGKTLKSYNPDCSFYISGALIYNQSPSEGKEYLICPHCNNVNTALLWGVDAVDGQTLNKQRGRSG